MLRLVGDRLGGGVPGHGAADQVRDVGELAADGRPVASFQREGRLGAAFHPIRPPRRVPRDAYFHTIDEPLLLKAGDLVAGYAAEADAVVAGPAGRLNWLAASITFGG